MKKFLVCFLLSILVIFITSCSQVIREEVTTTPNEDSKLITRLELEDLDEDMQRIVKFLYENKMIQMASIEANGTPSIRTIQFQFYENGRIYFQTDTNASIYRNLKKLPSMELVSSSQDETQSLRIKGEVVFENNHALIERTLSENPNIKKIYGSDGNPTLVMFYVEHGSAQIYEFSDKVQGTTLAYQW
ncbi:pyridoxamine 5'-phosphate oxidase family protein [Saliterribacillus persicus]|uniref:Putative pyridoxamine 5'-phosphate oxidase family protein n=1 Tax=Saliterribacillus persicus TaxID=930114 RepID=A0A368X559_9BACI|nr:pyridoxamine 5'-phosphate oxidase family protein [Saliterribacillus persicus]RCW63152.1 putative pyridoxamine 5'-phosphate oxidase family protein [Saliterribacillus persicus]